MNSSLPARAGQSMQPPAGRFWLGHALVPLLVFTAAFIALEVLGMDRRLTEAWYFDRTTDHWLGTGAGEWWARDLLHHRGRWLVRVVAAGALLAWLASFAIPALRHLRRDAGFVALAMLLSTAIVGGLKAVTNVDCPWDLAGYGGANPYVPLFGDRPDDLPHAKCFPGAHASSGFALLCFYFLWRDHLRRRAWAALGIGIAVGVAFSIGQEARGAHFMSHDLTSAAIVWFVQLGLYAWLLQPRAPAITAEPWPPSG